MKLERRTSLRLLNKTFIRVYIFRITPPLGGMIFHVFFGGAGFKRGRIDFLGNYIPLTFYFKRQKRKKTILFTHFKTSNELFHPIHLQIEAIRSSFSKCLILLKASIFTSDMSLWLLNAINSLKEKKKTLILMANTLVTWHNRD